MQLLDGIMQKILKAEKLNRICYELGPIAKCSQCKEEQPFSYITYSSKNNSRQKHENSEKQRSANKCLQCSKCLNEVPIKCDLETDKIIKSKVYTIYYLAMIYICSIFVNMLELQIWKIL